MTQFEADLDYTESHQAVAKDAQKAGSLGATATSTSLINDTLPEGAQPMASLE
ncbi:MULTISPECIES: hypothetical protein [unclassified Arthrobacter]|uniref:hypothetical protein n=1 Tax=unclassified Arthrobacter TaxID=235627 RepID=UPI002E06CAF6|nr:MULTISPECIES: hypothetical protein [unclassified Arthrobacter]MEC5193354.1 protein-disulfide isomerase [Arthrobacter sp. MP_M4]MEC5204820.1 protein-disulfide isomerase [Arthrobacter sp. MP_M7]